MENDWIRTAHTRDVGTLLPIVLRVKKFREETEKGVQTGIHGQWQQASPAREYLEQVKCCNYTDCTHRMMKHDFFALKSGAWEEYRSTFRTEVKATEWASDRTEEAFEKVAMDEARKAECRSRNHDKKYRLFAAGRAARWRHVVILVPAAIKPSISNLFRSL